MWLSYIINLQENVHRYSTVSEDFIKRGIHFERLNAIDGSSLNDEAIAKVYDIQKNSAQGRQPMIAAEMGCYLSHIAAWQKIATGNEDGGFVFEDDFTSDEHLAEILYALSIERSHDWDIVKLFSLKPDVALASRRPLLPDFDIGIPYRVPTCALGYGITRDAAQSLLKTSVPFFRPIDEDHKFVWETGLRVALVQPPPLKIGDQHSETGTIGQKRRAEKRTSIPQFWHQIKYGLRYRLALYKHRKHEGWKA